MVSALREQFSTLVKGLGVASIIEDDVLFGKTERAKLVPGSVGWDRGDGEPLDRDVGSFFFSIPHVGRECSVVLVPFVTEAFEVVSIANFKRTRRNSYIVLGIIDSTCYSDVSLIYDRFCKTLTIEWTVRFAPAVASGTQWLTQFLEIPQDLVVVPSYDIAQVRHGRVRQSKVSFVEQFAEVGVIWWEASLDYVGEHLSHVTPDGNIERRTKPDRLPLSVPTSVRNPGLVELKLTFISSLLECIFIDGFSIVKLYLGGGQLGEPILDGTRDLPQNVRG